MDCQESLETQVRGVFLVQMGLQENQALKGNLAILACLGTQACLVQQG